MIKQLAPLLKPGETLALTLAVESNGVLRVNIMPRLFSLDGEKGTQRQALNQPLTIAGTAEELDSPAVAEALAKFADNITGLRTTFDEADAAHQQAKETAKKTIPPKKPVSVTKPAAKPANVVKAKTPPRPSPGGKPAAKPAAASTPASQPQTEAAEAPVVPDVPAGYLRSPEPPEPPAPAPAPAPAAPATALDRTESLL